ncbi:hypothetical protein CUMW_184520 [Citrus unshiu]|uniref:Uncharacterized protein n=1 Tax=Citrus unshiu TaxID=55188 RepID=A0A2H5Q0D0_CITUN|nr:hypothetical protein CUMW_184520 [Citrus unshiu]
MGRGGSGFPLPPPPMGVGIPLPHFLRFRGEVTGVDMQTIGLSWIDLVSLTYNIGSARMHANAK